MYIISSKTLSVSERFTSRRFRSRDQGRALFSGRHSLRDCRDHERMGRDVLLLRRRYRTLLQFAWKF